MNKSLEELVGELLLARGLHLAVAESCTGGLISHLLTNVAGSSDYYLGGVTAYANEAKVRLIRVSSKTIDKYGAVSSETAIEMARGVRQVLKADVGISVTGIAGPSGGSSEKPIGTTWIGLSSAKGEYARQFLFKGDRMVIKGKAAQAAMSMLVEHLQKVYV